MGAAPHEIDPERSRVDEPLGRRRIDHERWLERDAVSHEKPPVGRADRLDGHPCERRRRARRDRDGDRVAAAIEGERQQERAAGDGPKPGDHLADALELALRVGTIARERRSEGLEAHVRRARRAAELSGEPERELLVARVGGAGQHRERSHRRA
jgi:hypothetical protein